MLDLFFLYAMLSTVIYIYICRVRLVWSRTPGFHPGNHGFESHTRYQQKTSAIRLIFLYVF
jgi:hypothetical protein